MRTFSVSNRMGAIAVIAAAAIALAACGGGGGLNEDEAAGLRDEVKAAEAAQAAAEAARAAAAAEAEAARTAQAAAEAAKQAAEAEATAAEAAKEAAEAQAAQQVADARAAQAAAEAAQAQAEADKVAAEARSAEEVAAANRQAEQARMEKETAEAEAMTAREARDTALAAQTTAEREKAAAERALATARQQLAAAQAAAQTARQAAEQAQRQAEQQQEQLQQQLTEAQQAELSARASSFGGALDAPDEGSAIVSWPRGGSLTFRPAGTLTRGSAAPSVPGSWRSASFTGQSGTATALIDETVYLYTNIQAPGNRAFWKVHGLSVTMDSDLAPLARGSSAAPTSGDTDPDTDGRQYTGLTVSGSLNGASGRFTCRCIGTVADGYDSHVTFTRGVPSFSGTWVFTPTNIANGYRVASDDAFLYFGIWSSIPDGITGTYDFDYIAGGGAESGMGLANFSALEGSATFRGGAVGRYVTQGQVGGQNAKIGTFTATATLNAHFSDGDTAGTLSGSITDFREDGSPLAGWQVTLGSDGDVGAASTITLADAADDASGDTVANIGGLPVAGEWGANFYGSNNPGFSALTDKTMYPATRYPPVDLAGVAGWFDATNTAASLAGAFAATPGR